MVEETVRVNGWPIKHILIDELFLDAHNYRLDAPSNASQEYLRELLFEQWKVIEMAESIVSYGGIYPSDNIIATFEDNKYIVLEGNRRLCAIQCLLNDSLIPQKFKKKFQARVQKIDSVLKTKIDSIAVAISPKRVDAEWLITAKHTDYATIKWPLLTQKRRAYDVFVQFGSVDKTSRFLGLSVNDTKENIETYALFLHIRSLKYLSPEEQDILSSNDLDATALTRNLSSSVVKVIGYKFDSKMRVISDLDIERTDYLLYKLACAAFVKETPQKIDTRSSKEFVLNLVNSYETEFNQINSKEVEEQKGQEEKDTNKTKIEDDGSKAQTGFGAKTEEEKKELEEKHIKGKKPVKYFSDLKCTIDDQRLKRLTQELSKIPMTQFPAAAIMLTRSLLESALIYQINKMNQKSEYHTHKGKDGLKKILLFSIEFKAKLFAEPKSVNGLEQFVHSKDKDFMDDIVHSRWIDPTPIDVSNIAAKVRELLKAILTDKA